MTHDSTARRTLDTPLLQKSRWTLPAIIVTLCATFALTPHAHAQNTPAAANPGNATTATGANGATGSGAFNPSADISRAVSHDTTDTAIQNNWNSIMHPPVQAKPEEKSAENPRRGRRGITPAISTN
ncbi:hypothetical protein [Pandoraea terrigena]|uniref:Uncharacterized protein n=1 Tax=Pandoraea terrigena TaxID=2508292 RepID=A0A5E4R9T3_9BURK|nr:hypothetical protein [Pandoraea terrigena]VVD59990.1 hypothetical protein PTE31013_00049 [Pandoraea terrigena]